MATAETAPQAVGFNINATNHSSLGERVACKFAGICKTPGHQWITQHGVLICEETQGLADYFDVEKVFPLVTPRNLIAGVIWNDVPTSESDETGIYVPDPIPPADAVRFGLQPRFAYNPPHHLLMKMGRLSLLPSMFYKNDIMWKSRFANEVQHWHSMSTNYGEHIPPEETVRRIVKSATEWMEMAMARKNIFYLGHVCHMCQDSYSAAHTNRRSANEGYAIVAFYRYSVQDEKKHSHADDDLHSERARQAQIVTAEILTIFRSYLFSVMRVRDPARENELRDAAQAKLSLLLHGHVYRLYKPT